MDIAILLMCMKMAWASLVYGLNNQLYGQHKWRVYRPALFFLWIAGFLGR